MPDRVPPESGRGISDECKRCGGEMSHDGSALDLLGYCEACGEQTQREYLAASLDPGGER